MLYNNALCPHRLLYSNIVRDIFLIGCSTVLIYVLDVSVFVFRLPGLCLSFLQSHTGSGAHPDSYSMDAENI